METLSGKVAVITGGASGIGLAMAHQFAGEGMKLTLADIEPEPLAMAETALKRVGAEVLIQRTDVSKEEDLERLADAAYARFGAVHVLCNNAGVGGSPGAAWELSAQDWQWVIDVDLWSVIHGVRTFVPRMLAGGEPGHIVNTASVAGLLTGAVGAPYTVAKFGVVALSESLYYELGRLGHDIGVSVLCPGFVDTNIFDSSRNRQAEYGDGAGLIGTDEQRRAMLDMLRPTMLKPEEVARQVSEAVKSKQLYVVPAQPGLTDRVKERSEHIAALTNPPVAVNPLFGNRT